MSAASSETAPGSAPLGPDQLHTLMFRRFRSLRDVEITLQSRFTVLIGANGSGKSSVLDGAHLLSQVLVPIHGEAKRTGGAAGLVFQGDRAVELVTTHDGKTAALGLRMATADSGFWLTAEAAEPTDTNPKRRFALGYGREWKGWKHPSKSPEDGEFMKGLRADPIARLGACVRLRLDARRARKPSHSDKSALSFRLTDLDSRRP